MSKPMKGFGRAGLSALATSTLIVGASFAGAGAAHADSAFQFQRVGGQDRYEVSANVAGMYGTADHVILASGEQGKYADSLAANYLSGAINAPILLTQLNTTPDATMAALKKAGATKITIVGGPLSVSTQQEDSLRAAGYTVDRIEGHTRYDVDAAVIKAASKTGDTAIVATGEKFPDALAAGPLAYAKNLPVGLVTLGNAPQQVIDALKAQGVTKAIVLGGDLSISQETRQQLENNGIKIIASLNGANRAAVATQLASYEIANYGFTKTRVNVATGREFSQGADALSAGPLTGKQNRPLLITAGDPKVGTTQAIGADLLQYLKDHSQDLTGTDNLLFGGPLSISDAKKTAMEQAAQTTTLPDSATTLPELRSAKVVSTTTPGQANSTNPQGTVVQYTFDEQVLSAPDETLFHLVTSGD
ncbi:MAG: cell wall-binding repeat-containing protein, partial [Marmoricola sp.]